MPLQGKLLGFPSLCVLTCVDLCGAQLLRKENLDVALATKVYLIIDVISLTGISRGMQLIIKEYRWFPNFARPAVSHEPPCSAVAVSSNLVLAGFH